MDRDDRLRQVLKQLAVEDPREARRRFLQELETDAPGVAAFLDQLTAPSDSRLRHLVANAIRTHPRKDRVVPHLLAWRDSESDEFTRRAIIAALNDVDEKPYAAENPDTRSTLPQIVEVYGYISD